MFIVVELSEVNVLVDWVRGWIEVDVFRPQVVSIYRLNSPLAFKIAYAGSRISL